MTFKTCWNLVNFLQDVLKFKNCLCEYEYDFKMSHLRHVQIGQVPYEKSVRV